jgi:hypothetical protein
MAEIRTPALEIHRPSILPLDQPLSCTEKGKHGRVWYGPGKPPFTHPTPVSACSLPRSPTLLAGLSSTSRHKTRNLKVISVCCLKKNMKLLWICLKSIRKIYLIKHVHFLLHLSTGIGRGGRRVQG